MNPVRTIKGEVTIHKSRSTVWNAIADVNSFCSVLPVVKRSQIVSKNREGVGVKRVCELYYAGASIEDKVTEWNAGKNIKMSWVKVKHIYGIVGLNLNLSVRDNGVQSVLTGSVNYAMRNVLFDVYDQVYLKKRISKLLDSALLGYKYYTESGLSVTTKTNLDFSKVRRL